MMNTPDSDQTDTLVLTVRSADHTLRLPLSADTSVRQALDTTELRVRAACGGMGSCGACLIQIVSGEFNPPTLAERQKLLPEDLAIGMRLACQLHGRSAGELYLDNPAPHSEWKSLDTSQLYRASTNNTIDQYVYGIAVDLGTTHIRLSLWNRQTGRRIGTRYSINPQVAHGADVLTRLSVEQQAADENRLIGEEARKAIIGGIRDILSRDMGEVSTILAEIGSVLIVGNTAMLMLICGNDTTSLHQPENWQLPIPCQPNDIDAWRKHWRMPHAEITIVQPLAGFIGSDLLADLIATNIIDQPLPVVLADFGTNTEIAVWDGQTLWTTSVPGGPAFEGVGMRNGLTAENGAICKVTKTDNNWHLQTIGGTIARGFCASGFIDAMALLVEAKLLKPSGRFAEPQPSNGYLLDSGNLHSAIFASDVDIFQRAKGSTAAAMAQLLALAGLTLSHIDTLWICGSFGQHLDLHSAFKVGLLPSIDPDRIRILANASLAGCEKMLLTTDRDSQLNAILERARTINLGGLLDYENRFVDNLRLQPWSTDNA